MSEFMMGGMAGKICIEEWVSFVGWFQSDVILT